MADEVYSREGEEEAGEGDGRGLRGCEESGLVAEVFEEEIEVVCPYTRSCQQCDMRS